MSAELELLREIRDELHVVRANQDLLREAVLGLGGRVARLERERLTPLPAGVPAPPHESWAPDHGDRRMR